MPDAGEVGGSVAGEVAANGAEGSAGGALDPAVAALLKRDGAGLVCAVVQQHGSGEVLMVGWMDDEALHRTLTSGRVTFWSRSRRQYWRKGDTSGHQQHVRSVSLDCDGDALLVRVDQVGPACHTGAHSCFDVHPLQPLVGDSRRHGRTAGVGEPAPSRAAQTP